jgi:hypothetical protein
VIWIILGVVLIIVIALLVLIRAKAQGESESTDYPYAKQVALFSPAERSFLGVLSEAIGDEAQIFGKVRVADVIMPKKGMSRGEWQKAFNKISGKHFDFILCDKGDLSIICAVELDDSSHQSKSRKERDLFLEGACNSSSVPLIQVPAKASYNIGEIKKLFSSHLSSQTITENAEEISSEVVSIDKEPAPVEKEDRVCPKCASRLVRRVAKKGDNAGNEFWACSSFPKCRYTEAINA